MREIKFRGKRQKDGKWIYGSYISRSQEHYLYDLIIDNKSRKKAVLRETVGQFTGLKDKNRKEIYEGDIVEYKNSWKAVVKHYEFTDGWKLFNVKNGNYLVQLQQNVASKVEVVGNKYEDGDMLES